MDVLKRYPSGVNVDLIAKIIGAMNAEGVRYIVFGGAAMNIWGISRFTEDADIFIEPSADNVNKLRLALKSVFDDPNIDEITAADLLGDYPAVQYVPPTGDFHLDILTRLGEAFVFSDLQSELVEFQGHKARVATPATLYKMKRDTVRPKDRLDAEILRERFKLDDDS